MAYQPQAGTIPIRAIEHLQSLPKGTKLPNAVLADALGVDKNALNASMVTPVKHGAIAREKKEDGLIYWALGNNVPLPLPHDFEPDDPLQPRAEPKKRGRRDRPEPLPQFQHQVDAFDEPLFCKFSDGRLGIQAEGHDLTLTAKTSSQLEHFLRNWPRPANP